MKTRLKDLYNCFYTPPEFSEQKQEVEEHRLVFADGDVLFAFLNFLFWAYVI